MTSSARATLTLVIANLAIYLVMLGCWLSRGLFPGMPDYLTSLLSLPSDLHRVMSHPWTILTYMFTHISFVHLTVNMLWLVGFGPTLRGNGRLTILTYLAGGLTGGLMFLLTQTLSDDKASILAGASASVIAVTLTAAVLSPSRRLDMLLFGNVKLKWVALIAVITMFAGSRTFSASTVAHLGGVIAGLVIAVVVKIRDRIIVERAMQKARIVTRQRTLISKAGKSGFASLSEPERLELFNLHKSFNNHSSSKASYR